MVHQLQVEAGLSIVDEPKVIWMITNSPAGLTTIGTTKLDWTAAGEHTTIAKAVTAAEAPKSNSVYTAARSADASATKKISLPRGTATVLAAVPIGNDGKLRIRTAKTSTLTIKVLGYTNALFTASS